jgi:hypothetical protein
VPMLYELVQAVGLCWALMSWESDEVDHRILVLLGMLMDQLGIDFLRSIYLRATCQSTGVPTF